MHLAIVVNGTKDPLRSILRLHQPHHSQTVEGEKRRRLIRSKGLTNSPTVAPFAHGQVKIESVGPVEIMKVKVWGLPPNTDFDFFVIQVPNPPFGLSWYQGDIETNKDRHPFQWGA